MVLSIRVNKIYSRIPKTRNYNMKGVITMQELSTYVIEGNRAQVADFVQKRIDSGNTVQSIVDGLISGMNIVGERFKGGEMFFPEVLMSANAMHSGMDIIAPLLKGNELQSLGTIVIGTVEGDLHDIGKNLVGMLIESGGFNVIDLGIDVPIENFIKAIREHKPVIVGLSALLTTTMPVMKQIIKMMDEEGVKDGVKVIVGGAPVSQEFADSIGADGYAPDAASAVDLCKMLVS